jgi:hypothetical protein
LQEVSGVLHLNVPKFIRAVFRLDYSLQEEALANIIRLQHLELHFPSPQKQKKIMVRLATETEVYRIAEIASLCITFKFLQA